MIQSTVTKVMYAAKLQCTHVVVMQPLINSVNCRPENKHDTIKVVVCNYNVHNIM